MSLLSERWNEAGQSEDFACHCERSEAISIPLRTAMDCAHARVLGPEGRFAPRNDSDAGRRLNQMSYAIEGSTGAWEVVVGLEVHAQVISQGKAVLRRRHRFRRAAELAGELRRCRVSRHAAGDQPRMRGAGGAHRAGAERAHQLGQPVRPQELLLCRPAGRLSDQPVPASDRRRGADRDRACRWFHARDRHHAPAPRAGRRQVAARSASDQDVHRSEPRPASR